MGIHINTVDIVTTQETEYIKVEKPKIIQKTVQRKRPIIQESITQVPKIVEQIVPVEVVVPETVEVPQVQFVDVVVDVPVTKQRQVPMLQTVQKTVEVPEVVYVDKVVDVPVTQQRQVPTVFETAARTIAAAPAVVA